MLHVEARNSRGQGADDIDDFIIDNVVIVYKTRDVPVTLPSFTGDLADFLKAQLMLSITNVKGSGDGADPADQHNEYVLPTASQLAAWRVVFRSLLAGSWGPAHLQARMISSTYNVVEFLDTPSGRTYFVLMEGVPGAIPAPAAHPSGVTITNPLTRRVDGALRPHPRRKSAEPLGAIPMTTQTEDQATKPPVPVAALAHRGQTDQHGRRACQQSNRPFRSDVSHTVETFQMASGDLFEPPAVASPVSWKQRG